MKLAFILRGQIKSGKNNMVVTRTGRHFPKREWAEWRDRAVAQITEQLGRPAPLAQPVAMLCRYWAGDGRRRDVPGMIDAIFHCLDKRQAHIVEDDSLIRWVKWDFMGLDKANPRAEIEIHDSLPKHIQFGIDAEEV